MKQAGHHFDEVDDRKASLSGCCAFAPECCLFAPLPGGSIEQSERSILHFAAPSFALASHFDFETHQ